MPSVGLPARSGFLSARRRAAFATAVLVAAAAVGLTYAFWQPLWAGGGFVGGDVYSFFLPQKVYYAERLADGEFPLWNNRTGHGYPLVGESQTGAFYPFNLALYATLDVHTAYNVNHLLHYVLAFVFAWMYARTAGLSRTAAGLAAVVYVYAWFPSRNCLEWAIITGAWLPLALWCAERFLQRVEGQGSFSRVGRALPTNRSQPENGGRCPPYLLSAVLAVQLLAGHFNIAFLTVVLLAVYVPVRLWLARGAGFQPAEEQAGNVLPARRAASLAIAAAAVAGGFALAAVQLLPTWELMRRSQRAETGEHHRLAQGFIPPAYWSQTIAPWHWYSLGTNRDKRLKEMAARRDAPTNQVEAHLYFGLGPLVLALTGVVIAFRARNRLALLWAAVGIVALLYTSAWLLPVTRHIPGFRYFQGPGRWGLLTTLAVALLAGYALDRLRHSWSGRAFFLPIAFAAAASAAAALLLIDDTAAAFAARPDLNPLSIAGVKLTLRNTAPGVAVLAVGVALTAAIGLGRRGRRSARTRRIAGPAFAAGLLAMVVLDLAVVGRLVTYSPMIADPPITHLDESPLREMFSTSDQPARVVAPGANLATVFGCARTPPYLTFGPAEYMQPQLSIPDTGKGLGVIFRGGEKQRMPRESPSAPKKDSRPLWDWLRCVGVTHIVAFEPLPGENEAGPVEFVWSGPDPVFNPAQGRPAEKPLYVYRLKESRRRAAFVVGDLSPEQPTTRQPRVNAHVVPASRMLGASGMLAAGSVSRVSEYRANRVTIETQAERPGRLLLTDLSEPGWQVSVNGEPAEAIVHESVFRAVEVPAGRHTVVWTYRPASLYWGAGISASALLALLALCAWRCRRRSKTPGELSRVAKRIG